MTSSGGADIKNNRARVHNATRKIHHVFDGRKVIGNLSNESATSWHNEGEETEKKQSQDRRKRDHSSDDLIVGESRCQASNGGVEHAH